MQARFGPVVPIAAVALTVFAAGATPRGQGAADLVAAAKPAGVATKLKPKSRASASTLAADGLRNSQLA